MARTQKLQILAWAGWWLPMPAAWRMWKVHGNSRAGSLMMGDDERPRLELKWAWVSKLRFDPDRTLRAFLARDIARAQRADAVKRIEEFSLPHFSSALSLRDGDRTWAAAYCGETRRILHWVFHGEGADGKGDGSWMKQWRDQPRDGEIAWRFFGVSFKVPSGFHLHSATLNLGDMEVVLGDPSDWRSRNRLVVRHVYPSSLALARRSIDAWLLDLFKARKGVYRACGEPREAPDPRGAGRVLRARLQFLLRFVLRPLCFRMPAGREASLHHIEDSNQLLYIDVAAPAGRMESIRQTILASSGKELAHG